MQLIPWKQKINIMALAGYAVAVSLPLILFTNAATVSADVLGPQTAQKRAIEARKLRTDAAQRNFGESLPSHPQNSDELTVAGKLNNYSKGLPHDANGIVDPVAYAALINALNSGKTADFEMIPMGVGDLGLRNPQAAFTYFFEGKDSHSFTMSSAPAFGSAHQAAEAIEVMWQALTRDVSFANYTNDELIAEAVTDMNRFSAFPGPKEAGHVTIGTLFRGIGSRETVGPYISQFLLQPIPFGATKIEQKYNVPINGNDHLTEYNEWLHIQKGGKPTGVTQVEFQTEPRYIYNGRAMAQYVLQDFVNQSYLGAARIIASYKKPNANGPHDPFQNSATQARGPLFGGNHIIDLLSRVSMGSQNVAWYQKWLVHRRARPEVFFGRVHNQLTNPTNNYGIHAELFESSAFDKVMTKYGTYLLPTATPDGSPLHPSYPAGHAVMAGAAVTMMKAFFNGETIIPKPMQPSSDGLALEPYTGPDLTVEGELNKLGSNISLGRDIAGLHYRTDGDWGMALGEEYAISVLRELVTTYAEDFTGFTFNKFDGSALTISK